MKLSAALIFIAACSGASSSPHTPSPSPSTGRAERFSIGSLSAFALEDGHLEMPNDGKSFIVAPVSDVGDALAAGGLPRDVIHLDLQCLLVEDGSRWLLFDTGAGGTFGDTGHLLQSFALAGVQPDVVTDVFISHAHGDHVSGLLTKAGALAFPEATIHISAPEWAALQADTADDSKQLVAAITPKVVPFEPGAQVLPSVKAVATEGHTPGHSSYEISDGHETLFYIGDVVHHPVLSFAHPEWTNAFDGDHDAATQVREATLGKLAADGTRVFAVHLPFPGLGHVVSSGTGFRWEPAR
jgi:glyoxylase-like metal-dependent hydrolase (beta-lactamase superfamily II)